jgi:hypothetical protein
LINWLISEEEIAIYPVGICSNGVNPSHPFEFTEDGVEIFFVVGKYDHPIFFTPSRLWQLFD